MSEQVSMYDCKECGAPLFDEAYILEGTEEYFCCRKCLENFIKRWNIDDIIDLLTEYGQYITLPRYERTDFCEEDWWKLTYKGE